MEQLGELQKVADAFGYEQDSISLAPSARKGTIMTEAGVKKLIREKLVEAVAVLQKEKCPHCGMVIGAPKVAKSAGADDFFSRYVYGGPPLQSPSGGLFGPPSSVAGAEKLTKVDQSQSPSGGLFDR
jgi:hypothetical protein